MSWWHPGGDHHPWRPLPHGSAQYRATDHHHARHQVASLSPRTSRVWSPRSSPPSHPSSRPKPVRV